MLRRPSGSTSSGTQVQLYHCHGYASNGAPQRWRFFPAVDSKGAPVYYEGLPLRDQRRGSGLCLTGTGVTGSAPVVLATCSLTTAKGLIRWKLLSTGNSTFALFAVDPVWAHDMCAVASNASGSNGTRLVMEPCDSSNPAGVFSLG